MPPSPVNAEQIHPSDYGLPQGAVGSTDAGSDEKLQLCAERRNPHTGT